MNRYQKLMSLSPQPESQKNLYWTVGALILAHVVNAPCIKNKQPEMTFKNINICSSLASSNGKNKKGEEEEGDVVTPPPPSLSLSLSLPRSLSLSL